ncbi:hypothetical protein BDQ17DRAFT_1496479 [Cyathus striatus]|nr:hypothetical protein BDQ17DRAFT_1496479 [Cyathus striatus]
MMPLIIIFYAFAMVSTIFRLIYRARCRQLWWDDFWALIALINTILVFAAYIRLDFPLSSALNSSIFFLVLVTARMAIWASRLSVAVTIVRIIATGKSLLISKLIAVMFGMIGIGIVLQKVILCSPPGYDYSCQDKSITSAYTDLASMYLRLKYSNFWLLGAPTYLLWRMKLKKQFYRLLQAIFATEILVLTTSILYCYYILKNDFQIICVIAHFRVTVSLIVCNLLFLVTYFYRQFRNGQEYTEDSTTSASSRTPNPRSYNATTHTGLTFGHSALTQISPMTSAFISSISRPSVAPSHILYESEPGIIDRQWSSAGVTRGVSMF